MTKFLEKNKIFIGIILVALIVWGTIYFSKVKVNKNLIGSLVSKEEFSSKPCANLPLLEDGTKKLVTKVIDGDTFLIEGGYSVRILGIDADERGYPCYQAAKEKLEELILNKEVRLEKEKEDFDQYCRYLRYVFADDKNVAFELVKEGLVVARFSPENIKYREEISLAEKEARENKIGCKWGNVAKVEEKTEFQWKNLTQDKTGLKVIDACQAGNYYGDEIIVEGKVVDAYLSKKNNVFLNFGKPYPNQCFSAVIFSSDLYKFGDNPEKYYNQKIVRIRGKIQEYQEKPEIILKNLSQIEVGR
jgi:Micrococcal nuclease (thermonuclease) homologs